MPRNRTQDYVPEVNILATYSGTEHYLFIYDDSPMSKTALLRQLGDFAFDADLSITLYDACLLADRLREVHNKTGLEVMW